MPDPITPPVTTTPPVTPPVTTPSVDESVTPPADVTPPTTPPATPPPTPPTGDTPPVTPPVTPPADGTTPPVTPPTTPPAAPVVDPVKLEEIKADLTKTATKGIMEKLGKALGFSKEETQELPQTKEELGKLIDKSIKDAFTKQREDQTAETQETQEAQDERVDTIVKGWHSEYQALSQANRVPKIIDPNSETDPGVMARKRLIQGIGKIISVEKAKGIQRTPAISEVLVINPKALSQPAGADLPISGNTGSESNEAGFSNADVHSKSMAQLAAGL